MTEKRFNLVDLLETLAIADGDECKYYQNCNDDFMSLCKELNALHEENEYYKSIFFELVETALTDKNCRELYCEGILNIFDKANSLNQARDMIKEHLK